MVSTHLLRLQSTGKDSIFLIPTEFPEDGCSSQYYRRRLKYGLHQLGDGVNRATRSGKRTNFSSCLKQEIKMHTLILDVSIRINNKIALFNLKKRFCLLSMTTASSTSSTIFLLREVVGGDLSIGASSHTAINADSRRFLVKELQCCHNKAAILAVPRYL